MCIKYTMSLLNIFRLLDTSLGPWWKISSSIISLTSSRPLHSLGADVGCGNGKYIGINKNVLLVGSDRTRKLIDIVVEKEHDGIVADGLETGFKSNMFVIII